MAAPPLAPVRTDTPPMSRRLLVYGAGGFTGRLVVQEALARGLQPIVAGRRRERLEELSHTHLLDQRAAALDDARGTQGLLRDVALVLNCAGPFRTTARPLAEACLEAGAHYLDISGEHETFESLASLHEAAVRRGVLLLPGVGFDVVPSDCLAALVAGRVPGARTLALALSGLDRISRGSALTVLDKLGEPVFVRRDGRLVECAPLSMTRTFDFGDGPREATAVSWADLATAHRTTGIPDVTVYYEATPVIRLGLGMKPYGELITRSPLGDVVRTLAGAALSGPAASERARGRGAVIAVAEDGRGRSFAARLCTPEVYDFTARTAVAIADRVLAGNLRPGFFTPGALLGPEFALSLPGVEYTTLAAVP
jgi:short subunit dehydrogenase-like uncharacterized protein